MYEINILVWPPLFAWTGYRLGALVEFGWVGAIAGAAIGLALAFRYISALFYDAEILAPWLTLAAFWVPERLRTPYLVGLCLAGVLRLLLGALLARRKK
jgi:hypothetical protein